MNSILERTAGSRFFAVSIALSLTLFANSALGFSISITQIGGTALNGVGFVGDTIEVAVDFTMAENEVMTGVAPTLWWDQEGGNVLDIVTATEGAGGLLGPFLVAPIVRDRFLLTDSPSGNPADRNDRFFNDPGVFSPNFGDDAIGTTFMTGFEAVIPFLTDEQLLTEIITNGLPGPASFRLGVVTLRLASVGTTTIGLFRDPASSFRTLVAGARGVTVSNDDIVFSDIPASAIGLEGFSVVVVPEPGTAVLMGLGLFGLGGVRRTRGPHRA